MPPLATPSILFCCSKIRKASDLAQAQEHVTAPILVTKLRRRKAERREPEEEKLPQPRPPEPKIDPVLLPRVGREKVKTNSTIVRISGASVSRIIRFLPIK